MSHRAAALNPLDCNPSGLGAVAWGNYDSASFATAALYRFSSEAPSSCVISGATSTPSTCETILSRAWMSFSTFTVVRADELSGVFSAFLRAIGASNRSIMGSVS